MMVLVLNAEQARLVARANGNVKIIDDGGNRLGTIARPFALRSIAEKRSRRGPVSDRSTDDFWERLAAVREE